MKKLLSTVIGLGASLGALAQQQDTAVETIARFHNMGSEGGAAADVVYYDNTISETGLVVYSSLLPHRALDDVTFNPGPGGGGSNLYTNQHTISWYNGTLTSFDFHVVFYDDLDPNATPVNSNPIPDGAYYVQVVDIAAGAWYSAVDLSSIGGVTFPDDTFAMDWLYYEPGSTTVLNAYATPIFPQTNSGPVVGWSDDIYWRDADSNGQYDPTDARYFGGPPNLANFFCKLEEISGSACNPCDTDCNGTVNGQDIDDFINILNGGAGCSPCAADADGNGSTNGQDIDDFIACLTP